MYTCAQATFEKESFSMVSTASHGLYNSLLKPNPSSTNVCSRSKEAGNSLWSLPQVPNICAHCCSFSLHVSFGEQKFGGGGGVWLNLFRVHCWTVLAQNFWEQWQKEGNFIRVGKTISLKQCYPQVFSTMCSKVWGERDVSRSCHFGFCSFSLTLWILCNTCSHTATSSECCISTSFLERTERVEMKRLFWAHSL